MSDKGCPICGKQPKYKTIPNTVDGYPTYECCITMSMPTIERLDKEWNTRHVPEGMALVLAEPDPAETRRIFAQICSTDMIDDDDFGLEFYKAMLNAAKG